MKLPETLILLFTIVLYTGCRKQPVYNTIEQISVDTEKLCADADEFFESYRYIVLETGQDALLGNIDNLDLDMDKIAINCGNDIFIYDIEGHFMSRFNKTGLGPDEYIDIADLKIKDDLLYILSRSSKQIKTYSLTGKHITSYQLPDFFQAFTIADNTVWLASMTCNNTKYEFAEYSLDKHSVIRESIPFEENQNFLYSQTIPFLMQRDNELYVTTPFSTTVDCIDMKTGETTSKLEFIFNTEKQLQDFGNNLSYQELYQVTANKPVVTRLGLMARTNDWTYLTADIFFKIGYFPNIFRFDHSDPKKPGKLMRIGLMTYEHFPFLKSKPLLFYNNSYVSVLDADMVLSIAENQEIDDFNKLGLTEESNPVIFLHKLK